MGVEKIDWLKLWNIKICDAWEVQSTWDNW